MKDKKYYIYVYLDPTLQGKFVYGNITFDNEPFYVGKGNGRRYIVHIESVLNEWKHDKNFNKHDKIKGILETGVLPIIIFLKENVVSETEALEYETSIIKLIGRKNLNMGPLLNLTDGGESPQLNEITLQKMRNAKLGKTHSMETRNKMKAAHMGEKNHFFGKHHSKDTKDLISKSRQGKLVGEKHPMYGKTHTAEVKKRLSEFRKTITGKNHPRSRTYEVTSPTGEVIVFTGAFDKNCCKLGIVSPVLLRHVAQGIRENYKGWKCRYML